MLITLADVEARAGQLFGDDQVDRVNAYIEDVTALIESYLGRSFQTEPAPPAVKAVACIEVLRFLNTDPGVASERVGDISTNYANNGDVTVLSRDAKVMLRPYRRGSGIGSIRVVSHLVQEGARSAS